MYPHMNEESMSLAVDAVNKRFLPHFIKKKREVDSSKSKFYKRYAKWLEGEFTLDLGTSSVDSCSECDVGGRPVKHFSECGKRAQYYKVNSLRECCSQELIDAAASSSREEEKRAVLDADSALALITQANLSKYQYETIRKTTKEKGYNIFPSYGKVLEAKTKCYPPNIEISEISAKVPLQSLLDHTVTRIFESRSDSETNNWPEELMLHTKWGIDGASGQSEYKQRFSADNNDASDSHLFLTSIVPLLITPTTFTETESREIWKNERPSSTNYCRALHFQFKKETPELTRLEKNRVDMEIKELSETFITSGTRTLRVSHKLHFTMIDGKVAQVVTNTSSASNCILCGAKPSQLNDMSRYGCPILKEEALLLGMSTLHARIKFMEYILHLSYNMQFEAWRTTPATRPIKEEKKKHVQDEFLKRMGLYVDMVKQGTGTTNDGNTSRRFFSNPALVAEITQVDERLISRLGVILEVICCLSPIDTSKFREYSHETATLATTLYPWYYLPANIHKILFHGTEIIESAALPIGSLSEEAQECRNKHYKYFRTHHSRKCSRLATNEDVFHQMLISSDPFISSLRPQFKTKNAAK
ncbi:Hypothetical protein NTJ_04193 [Nesidiocoris tenuis]|uniref:Uncharacterized protein n=1 Tax=Nesidiocoris tenuis TaxID=355587 RepID=A0ABN7AJ44_9HEMI|nr:Hypothetical protein NTJ_04193 [Nesidiocoris tenuis]